MAPCKGYEPKAGIGELPAEMDQGARRLVGTSQAKILVFRWLVLQTSRSGVLLCPCGHRLKGVLNRLRNNPYICWCRYFGVHLYRHFLILYIKQSYNLEDLRVRSYIGIRTMVILVLAVSYFAAVYLGQNLKLKLLVERIFLVSKRFFVVPSFFNYAIADGLYNLLFPDKTGLKTKRDKTEDFQLCFSFW